MRRISLTLMLAALACGLVGCPASDWLPRFFLDADTNPAGAGSVLLDPPPGEDGAYPLGECVRANIEPAEGQVFLGWEGVAAGISEPVQLRMDQDRALSASFVPSDQAGLLGAWQITRGFLYNTYFGVYDWDLPFELWVGPAPDEEPQEEEQERVSQIFFDGDKMHVLLEGLMTPGAETWDGRSYAAVKAFNLDHLQWVAQGTYTEAGNTQGFIAKLAPDWPVYEGPPEVTPMGYPSLFYLLARDYDPDLPEVPEDLRGWHAELMQAIYPELYAANAWIVERKGDTLRIGFANPGGLSLDELAAVEDGQTELADLARGGYGYFECQRTGGAMMEADWGRLGSLLEGMWMAIPPYGTHSPSAMAQVDVDPDDGQFHAMFWAASYPEDAAGVHAIARYISGPCILDRSVYPHEFEVHGEFAEVHASDPSGWDEEPVRHIEDAVVKVLFRVDEAERRIDFVIGEPNGERPRSLRGAHEVYPVGTDWLIFY